MSKAEKIARFDPNGVAVKNGNFIGLPFEATEAEVVLFPAPWDVTVSSAAGTSTGAENIRQASRQLDLYDPDVPGAWKMGLYMPPADTYWQKRNKELRALARTHIDFLEDGEDPSTDDEIAANLQKLNHACLELKEWIKTSCRQILERNQLVGLIGGDHSTPLGLLEALAERHAKFGILQIDAHLDLRESYEGFTYSHASIFYNARRLDNISKIVPVGIRDYCESELQLAQSQPDRFRIFFDHELADRRLRGASWAACCRDIIDALPDKVYISFDIDGLDPQLCPNTGTPVPGGLTYHQIMLLLRLLARSGRTIIGFDLSEVAGRDYDWDGNVGARVAYKLANWMGWSNGRI